MKVGGFYVKNDSLWLHTMINNLNLPYKKGLASLIFRLFFEVGLGCCHVRKEETGPTRKGTRDKTQEGHF